MSASAITRGELAQWPVSTRGSASLPDWKARLDEKGVEIHEEMAVAEEVAAWDVRIEQDHVASAWRLAWERMSSSTWTY